MRIVVDAMGGDQAPASTVGGAVAAARDFGLGVVLTGDRTRIEPELGKHQTDGLSIEVRHAGEEIGMDEAPTTALRKSDSSLAAALMAHRDGDAQALDARQFVHDVVRFVLRHELRPPIGCAGLYAEAVQREAERERPGRNRRCILVHDPDVVDLDDQVRHDRRCHPLRERAAAPQVLAADAAISVDAAHN